MCFSERTPVDRSDHDEINDKAEDRRGRQVNREACVAEMREARDDHVLRVAGDGRGAADVAGGREAQQQRDGIDVGNFSGVDYQRRERQAYNVVDEERGEEAGRRDGHREHAEAGPRTAEQGAREISERAGQAQIRHYDHHPEQQRDRVEVDSAHGGGFAEGARHNHRNCARERRAGAIDPQPRNFAQRDHRVGQAENGEGQEMAGKHRGISRQQGVGRVGTGGIVQAYRYGNSTQGG